MPFRLAVLMLTAVVACPALAQSADPLGGLLREDGKRLPARDGGPETGFAELLSGALGVDVKTIERLEQPDEDRSFAGREVSGKGRRVRYRGLSVVRLKFGSPSAASVYAGSVIGRVDPGDDTIVTAALGKDASIEVVNEAEAQARGLAFSKELSLLLGRKELGRDDHTGSVVVPNNRPGFHGVSLRFEGGLVVTRLAFRSGTAARDTIETCVDPETSQRVVGDQRGKQLLLFRGARLDDVEFAKRVLREGWSGWERVRGERVTIVVCAPSKRGANNFVAYTRENGKLYQAGAEVLRTARKRTRRKKVEGKSSGIAWRFLDGQNRNHLVFWSDDLYGGAVARPQSMFVAINPDKDTCKAERTYFAELLRAIDYKLPPKSRSGMAELLAPPRK